MSFLKLMILGSVVLSTSVFATPLQQYQIAVVSFNDCLQNSKKGQKEQLSFDKLRDQMNALMEENQKQIQALTEKANDSEYMAGLSPEGEEEMRKQFQDLHAEMQRYQSQFYQVLGQAQNQMAKEINLAVEEVCSKIAKEKGLQAIVRKEACFFSEDVVDITKTVISELDKNFIALENTKKIVQKENVK